MLFNSFEYLFFFSFVFAFAWVVGGKGHLRVLFLVLASYYFYASNNGWLLLLILLSTQIDYFCGLRIQNSSHPLEKKRYLLISIVSNLTVLGFFKYFNFFASTVQQIFALWGVSLGWFELNIILPVGISFYTFQSMGYSIDVYRGDIRAETSWWRFAFYVSFFPQLIAGPIVRADQFIPQISKRPELPDRAFEEGVLLIVKGLAKKLILADLLSLYADLAFERPGELGSFDLWVGLYAFTFQIYYDFSGYTDIAIGSSRLLGFSLPINFNNPYAATNPSDFWRRWHISLSSWLRDYLYIPLGGNRTGRADRNLMITMTLGGLWHGAAWNFVLWGIVHGIYLIIYKRVKIGWAVPVWLQKIFFFHLIAFTWLLFRCDSFSQFSLFLSGLFSGIAGEVITLGPIVVLVLCGLSFLWQNLIDGKAYIEHFLNRSLPVKLLVYLFVFLLVLIFTADDPKPFIYFRF